MPTQNIRGSEFRPEVLAGIEKSVPVSVDAPGCHYLKVSQNEGSLFASPHSDYYVVYWGLYWGPIFTDTAIRAQGRGMIVGHVDMQPSDEFKGLGMLSSCEPETLNCS